MRILIAIPARYASSRFPGKPLVPILGKPLVQRVYETAVKAASIHSDIDCIVTTEDQRIMDFCQTNKINSILTSANCNNGTERIQELLTQLNYQPEFIINLQGDNPLCPPWIISAIINAYKQEPSIEVVTPCAALTWSELDILRQQKIATPFTGTTVIVDKNMYAIWFSKQILPAIRNEKQDRQTQPQCSPVLRHIGLYGYRYDILQQLTTLPASYYEQYEGLEQLRFLEHGIKIKLVMVDYQGRESNSGVDSPQDIARVEQLITKYGEL